MMATHIVTIGIKFSDGKNPAITVQEIFRGSEIECKRVVQNAATASDDCRQIREAWIEWGTIADWEEFIGGNE